MLSKAHIWPALSWHRTEQFCTEPAGSLPVSCISSHTCGILAMLFRPIYITLCVRHASWSRLLSMLVSMRRAGLSACCPPDTDRHMHARTAINCSTQKHGKPGIAVSRLLLALSTRRWHRLPSSLGRAVSRLPSRLSRCRELMLTTAADTHAWLSELHSRHRVQSSMTGWRPLDRGESHRDSHPSSSLRASTWGRQALC